MAIWLVTVATVGGVALSAPIVRRWLVVRDILDQPNPRSSHRAPVPRGGGYACIAGLLVGAGMAAAQGYPVPVSVIVAALILAAVGALDDRYGLPATPRLVSQIVVGAALGGSFGGVEAAAFGALAVPFIVNVVNFMDGINGITALTCTVWAVTATLLGWLGNSTSLGVLGAITLGAALGFLPWNVPRARLFLGDVGSYLFGALLAGGVVMSFERDLRSSLLVAPLILGIFDVLYTLASRAKRRVPLLRAHREHLYQRFSASSGLPHWVTATMFASGAAGMTIMAYYGGVLAVVGALLVLLIYATLPGFSVRVAAGRSGRE